MERFQLIIFRIMDVFFGVRSDQIFEIFNPESFSDSDVKVYEFERIIPFKKSLSVEYRSPKIITPSQNKIKHGVKVESPEDIISADANMIQPVPTLIANSNASKVFCGVIIHKDRLVLLVDFLALLTEAKQRC